MHLFYYPHIEEKIFTLDKTESLHCARVLRLRENDIIYLTDGKGKLCRAQIISPDKKACVTQITKVTNVPREREYSLQIAISPTKSIARFEWFLEKATEIGIDSVIPVMCKNSERLIIKEERLKKVIISAMKQSLKSWLPDISPFITFSQLVRESFNGDKFIATGSEPVHNHLGMHCNLGSNTLIVIGPEGDFNQEEMNLALQNNFIPASLGKSRLRTETAGVAACHTVNLINTLNLNPGVKQGL